MKPVCCRQMRLTAALIALIVNQNGSARKCCKIGSILTDYGRCSICRCEQVGWYLNRLEIAEAKGRRQARIAEVKDV